MMLTPKTIPFEYAGQPLDILFLESRPHSSTKRVLIFLPGIGAAPEQFEPLVSHFCPDFLQNSLILIPDLGKIASQMLSHQPQEPITAERLVETLRGFMRTRAGSENPPLHLVGHSLGGLLGIEWAGSSSEPETRPDQSLASPSRLVLLDVPMLVPPEVLAVVSSVDVDLRGPDYQHTLQSFASQFFFRAEDESERKKEILRDFSRVPHAEFLALWEIANFHNPLPAMERCRAASLFLHSSVPTDLERMRAIWPELQIDRLSGLGHYLHLEDPKGISERIAMFLE